ncbi:MAG TPA: endolytic transglycosylase MltG, partial [Ilumatobacteraceae bacterium]|nr:endolytic transglycosylase MltG [Ilumatobacteraceae bacterium]
MSKRGTALDDLDWEHDPWDDPDVTDALVLERQRRSHRSVKYITYFAGIVAIAGLIVAGCVGMWYLRQVNPSGDAGAVEVFKVLPTDTVDSISKRLQDRGLITNARVFRYYVDHNGGLVLTPGDYELRPRDHIGNLMRVLSTPPSLTYTNVTFPEGFTLEKMSQRLYQKLPRTDPTAFMTAVTDGSLRSPLQPDGATSLEGLLFPDTYRISADETPSHVAARMIDLMGLVVRQEDVEAKAAQLGFSPYQMIIIASMIEREAKVDEDRPKIARVIINRFNLGMPLQIDATLLYGQPPGTSISDAINLDTPYNTYMHTGLPLTPIANPGRASIEAAVNPAPDPS